MAIVRINGKEINTVNGKKVRAIHYGDKTWYIEEDSKDFTYTIANNEISITGYTGSDTEIFIPNYIENKPVTKIDVGAFYNNDIIETVHIRSNVKVIEEQSFAYCDNLTNVYIGTINGSVINSNLSTIRIQAFVECQKLDSIIIPPNVTTIEVEALAISKDNNGVIIFKGSIPPTIEIGAIIPETIKEIRVPVGYGDVYKTWDENWEALASYIVEGE